MNHPVDVDYIRKMVPNISDDVVEKQKTLQSGTCLGFGSAFKIPLIVKLKMPDPMPKSGNCDVVSIWNGNKQVAKESIENNNSVVINQDKPVVSGSISNTQQVINPVQEIPVINNSIPDKSIDSNNQQVVKPVQEIPVVNNVIPNQPIESNFNNQETINPVPLPSNEVISPVPEIMPGLVGSSTNPNLI